MSSGPATATDLRLLDDAPATAATEPWYVLVVDDDPEVHAVTRLAIGDLRFADKPVEVLSARSGEEARAVLQARPDIALILLDVVMETDHAGLDVVRYVREELANEVVRIVLRTGQPGQAPARDIVARYEIDDYRTKTELTFERLNTLVMTALRAYRLLRQLQTQQRELLRSNHELERFAYVASHDLQAPLRGIVGFTQLLQRRKGAELDADSNELLDSILRGGLELHKLITDLLRFSRLGREAAEFAPVDLGAAVMRALGRLQSVVGERQARVVVGALPTVSGNSTQLEQLFCNLIENGIKFQPADEPRVEISGAREGPEWVLRVRDHGIGIEPQYLDRIFEPFRRLHSPEEFPGTGIGLAICRKVVQLHGGTLHAESAPGAGTTFVIRLPAEAQGR